MPPVDTKIPSEAKFDPRSAAFIANPYPVLRQLRERAPLQQTSDGYWLALGHAEVSTILKDRNFGHAFVESRHRLYGPDAMSEPCFRLAARGMSALNPPDHTHVRKQVIHAFSARLVDQMKPRISEVVGMLLEKVADQGEMDVIRDFAHPLPVIVICDLLGMPEEDRQRFMDGSAFPARLSDPTPMDRQELDEANRLYELLEEYFNKLIAERRKKPGQDLISMLVAEGGDTGLDAADIIANIILLFAAGHETTTNLIGNGLLSLHRFPQQLEKLKQSPDLMPLAIEEMLRYEPPLQISVRTALQDVTVGQITLAKGSTVITSLAAANRDPAMFPDPDQLDISRTNVRPVTASFGGGIHTCLGAYLARVEGQIAFSALLERLPTLRLTHVDMPDWRQTYALRGLLSLPASW